MGKCLIFQKVWKWVRSCDGKVRVVVNIYEHN